MNCPKCNSRMTLLFTSAVCDACDPKEPDGYNIKVRLTRLGSLQVGESKGDASKCVCWTAQTRESQLGTVLPCSTVYSGVQAMVTRLVYNGFRGVYYIVGIDDALTVQYVKCSEII